MTMNLVIFAYPGIIPDALLTEPSNIG